MAFLWVTTYDCSSFYDRSALVDHGDWDVDLSLSMRISSGLTQALLRRQVFLEEVSGPHTLKIINLIYFSPLHNDTLITIHK
jgi:hypothetical protein